MTRHFLRDDDLTQAEQTDVLDLAERLKADRWLEKPLEGPQTVAVMFDKSSTRTRVSFAVGIADLGGSPLVMDRATTQAGRGESVEDTARVLGRMVSGVVWRTYHQDDLETMAAMSGVPVVNALSDDFHPCQILADLQTIAEHSGPVAGKTIAWVGDGNNVCHSFMHAAPKFGFHLNVACPAEYHPDLRDLAKGGDAVTLTSDPREAAAGADVIVTDTWVSMGDQDYEARLAAFEHYAVDEALMDLADPNAVFLHCLPAHRGEEVTDAVIDGPKSLVWDEAENRIHAQKAVLAWCFAG